LLNSAGTNAKLGASRYFVAEADESDASFLHLQPMTSVVTNIDADHMGTYDGDFNKLKDTFVQFLHNLPFYGLAVVCVDNDVVRDILPSVTRPMITYGVSDTADVRAENIKFNGLTTSFTVLRNGTEGELNITLNMPGHHNVLNSLAAIAVATDEGIADAAIVSAIIAMAESLGLETVAEGVETIEQMEFLRAKHCKIGQGYLFSKPLSREQLDQYLSAKTTDLTALQNNPVL